MIEEYYIRSCCMKKVRYHESLCYELVLSKGYWCSCVDERRPMIHVRIKFDD